ncbi:hypothetical protein [Streptomyces sp. WMMC905]|uniref:hypothetical protein n=1 Tax=Streptomyces sp. WMMC905 TaxID=3404123 RepID=UPI003B936103
MDELTEGDSGYLRLTKDPVTVTFVVSAACPATGSLTGLGGFMAMAAVDGG